MHPLYPSYTHTHILAEATVESLVERADTTLMSELSVNSDTMDDVPDPTSVTYIDYDNPFSLVEQSHGAPHIMQLSPHAWVGCGGDVYVLECLGKGFIRVEPAQTEEGQWPL